MLASDYHVLKAHSVETSATTKVLLQMFNVCTQVSALVKGF